MKPRRFHGLKRPKIRQTWNKYNLYNLFKMRDPRIGQTDHETFFQQKWRAKGMLRGYHGEHVVERKWERMFSRRLLGVVNMSPKDMALNDGSKHADGRGSGRHEPPVNWTIETDKPAPHTPYMQMAFAPMERRLDIAVFRAMFASSARQARQLCVHRKVKVNGKVMPYPAYRLNPGDMFQVDPDMVMMATGQQKRPESDNPRKARARSSSNAEDDAEPVEEEAAEAEAEAEAEEDAEPVAAKEQDPDTTDAPEPEKVNFKPTRREVQKVVEQAREVLREKELSAGQKQKLRGFIKQARSLLANAGRLHITPRAVAVELTRLAIELSPQSSEKSSESGESSSSSSTSSKTRSDAEDGPLSSFSPSDIEGLDEFERAALVELIQAEDDNPHDPSKPYLTPWRPREYMSPFAFIPQYLEVNQKVCAAVYLRHPVARVGSAEVPTPYPVTINQLAFNWYLRRR